MYWGVLAAIISGKRDSVMRLACPLGITIVVEPSVLHSFGIQANAGKVILAPIKLNTGKEWTIILIRHSSK